jgi:hypothetical protein
MEDEINAKISFLICHKLKLAEKKELRISEIVYLKTSKFLSEYFFWLLTEI